MTRAPAAFVLIALMAIGPVAAASVDGLANVIGDRVAGEAIDCIAAAEIEQVRLVPGGFAYVMRSPATVFVNRPPTGTNFIHDGVTPSVVLTSALLCRGQAVRLLNENSRAPVATVHLGEFVAYRRPVRP